jgi:hypothetical protein
MYSPRSLPWGSLTTRLWRDGSHLFNVSPTPRSGTDIMESCVWRCSRDDPLLVYERPRTTSTMNVYADRSSVARSQSMTEANAWCWLIITQMRHNTVWWSTAARSWTSEGQEFAYALRYCLWVSSAYAESPTNWCWTSEGQEFALHSFVHDYEFCICRISKSTIDNVSL